MLRGVLSAMAAVVAVAVVVVVDMIARGAGATKEEVRICSSDRGKSSWRKASEARKDAAR